MNRRGDIAWVLEFLGKLIFYSLILVAIIYMGMKLAEPFYVAGEKDWRVKQNFYLLSDAIDSVLEEDSFFGGSEKPPSAVIHVPNMRMIVGFDENQDLVQIFLDKKFRIRDARQEIPKPKECDKKACICALRIAIGLDDIGEDSKGEPKQFDTKVVECKKLKVKHVASTHGDVGLYTATFFITFELAAKVATKPSVDGREAHDVLFTGPLGPRYVRVSLHGDTLLLDPVCYDAEYDDDTSCKPRRVA